jgi:hypothetical protein
MRSKTMTTRSMPSPGELLWPALLAVAAIGGSWLFACVTPFAAFAAVAATTERPRTALATVALIWAANQAVGFAFLDYPHDASTLLWGLAIGAAALLATAAASLVAARLDTAQRWARLGAAFLAAFAVYEVGLLVPAAATGDLANFAPAIVGDVALLDLAWLAGLALAIEALARLGWPRFSIRRLPA